MSWIIAIIKNYKLDTAILIYNYVLIYNNHVIDESLALL